MFEVNYTVLVQVVEYNITLEVMEEESHTDYRELILVEQDNFPLVG